MITSLTLKNFKNVESQIYDFTRFDLLIGPNNSGKSTVLQALAIWQYCIDEFRSSSRTGSKGIQVVLPNFTALPVPEFSLLWRNKTDRHWPVNEKTGVKKQEYILIEIEVKWQTDAMVNRSFGIHLRYHSPQTIYAIPAEGWGVFRELCNEGNMPKVAYVPPFSGLEPAERWMDVSPIRQHIGKGQPGGVLRNLLLQAYNPNKEQVNKSYKPPKDWEDLVFFIQKCFSIDLMTPIYDSQKDVHIKLEYKKGKDTFDIISGGSGFHQTLTLLAFIYGYKATTVLLDEPDAHMHVNLQRRILDYLKDVSNSNGTQFLTATHAEEFARGVNATQIVSLISHRSPGRIDSTDALLKAMSEVNNEEITRLLSSPYLLYVEGEDDERIIRAWCDQCGARESVNKIVFKIMGGGTKKLMKQNADSHFEAIRQIIPNAERKMLFDYDSDVTAFHPQPENSVLHEWNRKNIENYLLVPTAWQKALLKAIGLPSPDLFSKPYEDEIEQFFSNENLTLPKGKSWRDVNANIFQIVDGKILLFESPNSLFHKIKARGHGAKVTRELVATNMTADEIHEDVHSFMGALNAFVA